MNSKLNRAIEERILLLDGGFGTMVQGHKLAEEHYRGDEFATWGVELKGCNDILSLTRPDIVQGIHREYLEAGSDIVTTNTFNANSISLADYGLQALSYRISLEAATLARTVADEYTATTPHKPRFVAGSIGPTNRTSSIASDVMNPASREVSFDTLVDAYCEQVRALIDGGVDILLVETAFDTLNVKAALYAINKTQLSMGTHLPIMISATIADASGRTLSGQTIEAFYTTIAHAKPLSIGLNCAFGAQQMLPYLERLSAIAQCAISAHPNAGLPNISGGYDETPKMFADDVSQYMQRGIINIIGGCCGTTPQHIVELSQIVGNYSPRQTPQTPPTTHLSGLERLTISAEKNFINIGERCNVAGSAKFARLIREGAFSEAVSIARAQVDAGAQIIDVCMDDAMIDSERAMPKLLNMLSAEPEIARLPIMVDSSNWDTITESLKVLQGKPIVNSISLKDGEAKFLERALEINRYGAAVVVMLFDERGQAESFERKVEIAQRAYTILTEGGFAPENIIFDPNILAIATGIKEHDTYAKAFIDATRWIKQNLPYAKVSGGVSNLSFAFRGNTALREAMHSVFLYHAIEAGMDMGIVNAQSGIVYSQIDDELRERVEDAILCRREDAAERLIEYATKVKNDKTEQALPDTTWRTLPLKERIEWAMIKGIEERIESDTEEAIGELKEPIKVIDTLLMPAMERVGELFSRGEMFLPQVVKTARIMKRAVAVLTPHLEQGDMKSHKKRILVATVKGDVHDIGKNIAAVVMSCNGYEINDLGVMVECERIVDEAQRWGADCICLSGLITPSLEEMIKVCEECERRGITTPIIISGATTSPLHTAVKIAPHYSGVTIHSANVSYNNYILSHLFSDDKELYIDKIKYDQMLLRKDFERKANAKELLPLDEARKASEGAQPTTATPQHKGKVVLHDFEISDVEPYIDWQMLLHGWGIKGRYPDILEHPERGEEAQKVLADAKALLEDIKRGRKLTLQAVVGIFDAVREGDDIIITDTKGRQKRLAMLRNQTRGDRNLSLADFLPAKGGAIGCFALTAGVGLSEIVEKAKSEGDDYTAIMAKLLADRLTEAFAEAVHEFVRRDMWGYEEGEKLSAEQIIAGKYRGRRVAFGYPACPDHSLKSDIFELLAVPITTMMRLTENYMITPAEALCGLLFADADYFSVGKIGDDQLADYASRRAMSEEQVKALIPNNIL